MGGLRPMMVLLDISLKRAVGSRPKQAASDRHIKTSAHATTCRWHVSEHPGYI